MNRINSRAFAKVLFVAIFLLALQADAEVKVGIGTGDVTPPIGTPSAGYGARHGAGMKGVHDPLQATAIIIDNGEKKIAFVGVDHLGLGAGIIQKIKKAVADSGKLASCDIYIGSSHTHAGGGAFLDVPMIGEILAGKYNPAAVQVYIDGTVKAILAATEKMEPAKIGIGHGKVDNLNGYRAGWPPNIQTVPDVAIIKMTHPDGSPLAVLFNYAAHPTVLGASNMEFSADFVGYARNHLRQALGDKVQAVFINGAQGDVSPRPPGQGDGFAKCDAMGKTLADAVKQIWDGTEVADAIKIKTLNETYLLEPKPTASGTPVPLPAQNTEMNIIVFDDVHAFVTIPGELSCIYDGDIKRFGGWLGYKDVSILGLTNDAHGYIIMPEAWRHITYESTVSFGGEMYGEIVKNKAFALLHTMEPAGALHADKAKPSAYLTKPPAQGAK